MFRTIMKPTRLGCIAVVAAGIGMAVVAAASAQPRFKTPEAAAEALAEAVRRGNGEAVTAVLGRGPRDLVSSGDRVEDAAARKAFLDAYDAGHRIVSEPGKPATLVIGKDGFPFPIPIAKAGDAWRFDTAAGLDEVFARRIGRNELAAVQACLAYVDAQYEYADMTAKTSGRSVYARRIISRPGQHDGLYWPTVDGQPKSPLGEAFARASRRGYRLGGGEPFHGYRYRILTRQGARAPGGAIDYVADGKMIGGFALVAWPARYGASGVVTFLVNHRGEVFQKDLGVRTRRIASRIRAFDPDRTWSRVTGFAKP